MPTVEIDEQELAELKARVEAVAAEHQAFKAEQAAALEEAQAGRTTADGARQQAETDRDAARVELAGVREELTKLRTVPGGSAQRETLDLSSLSPAEKIRAGLEMSRQA